MFTNTLNGITHNALHGSWWLAVATIVTDDSYFSRYSLPLTYLFFLHCVSVSVRYYYVKGLLTVLFSVTAVNLCSGLCENY